MQSLFIEELLQIFFLNCNNNPSDFISNFNQSKSIIGYNFRCDEHRFTHVSTSFKTILGYNLQNILHNGNFTAKIVHPQDKDSIIKCLKCSNFGHEKDAGKANFDIFSQIKCRAKHIRGYWKYFLIYAQCYWNERDDAKEKIGLIVDQRIKSDPSLTSIKKSIKPEDRDDTSLKTSSFNTSKDLDLISPRENEVLEMISNGYLTKEIASKLNISDSTVITHRKNLISKLDVRNTAELIKKAARHMLI
jgi:DNA-binding CsgD family transcriptional regulator